MLHNIVVQFVGERVRIQIAIAYGVVRMLMSCRVRAYRVSQGPGLPSDVVLRLQSVGGDRPKSSKRFSNLEIYRN